jgi:hypothetical protein
MCRRWAVAAVLMVIGAASGCASPLGKQYEYEEQLYLTVKGSATVIVDASVPALVALHGAALDPSPLARADPALVRRVFEAGGCRVVRVGQPWRRSGRRFVQVRIEADDVRALSKCSMLGWSAYTFERDEAGIHFVQQIGPPRGTPPKVNWSGDELIAFKLHAPSRVLYHNVRRFDDNQPGAPDRGNILTWEQRLTDRMAGKPLTLEVRLEPQAILYRTLLLFGGSFAAALIAMGLVVYLIVRRGRAKAKTTGATGSTGSTGARNE